MPLEAAPAFYPAQRGKRCLRAAKNSSRRLFPKNWGPCMAYGYFLPSFSQIPDRFFHRSALDGKFIRRF
ncbi:MAG: hypothetical protein EBS01_08625 [Verrucomicrobia bacterium]|nr:hypothetical protein [Verrucomicrobiota bacterium]